MNWHSFYLFVHKHTISINDFGLSRKKSNDTKELVAPKDVIAPWRWEAPESLSRMRVFSEKTDVFSFGCLLWELFARRHPFDWIDHGNVLQ